MDDKELKQYLKKEEYEKLSANRKRMKYKHKFARKLRDIPSRYVNVTHHQLIHGDFDGDGTFNIDDKKPFDNRVNTPIDKEVSFTTAFDALSDYRKKATQAAIMNRKKLGKRLKYRIKTQPSILKKLVIKKLPLINDIVGFRYVTNTRTEARKAWKKLKGSKNIKVLKKEDKYRQLGKSKAFYRAYHADILMKGSNIPAEMQFLSEAQVKTNYKGHLVYKEMDYLGQPYIPHLYRETKDNIRRGL